MSAMDRSRHRHQRRYFWWAKDDAITMLTELLGTLRAGSDDIKLVVYEGQDEQGHAELWHCTEDRETYGPGYDNSHLCPPLC